MVVGRRLWTVVKRSAAVLAAVSCWVALVNRGVLPLAHFQAPKAVLGALACFGFLVVPVWRAWRGPWLFMCSSTLLLLVGLEAHDVWLRRQYQASDADAPEVSLWHPVTTLDLFVHRYSARLKSLPVPSLRLVHVTDLHITEALPSEYYARIVREITALEPDVVVFTGDYISSVDRLPLLERWLRGLPQPRLGSYAVLGNHEHWLPIASEIAASLTRAGMSVITGECVALPSAETGGLRLCGTDAPWGTELPANTPAMGDGARPTPFIALSHTPDNIYELSERGAFAVLAGHTHGGQIRLPPWGAVFVPSRYGRRFDRGHFLVGDTHLYVSQGVGADSPPLRLWCRPELVVLDLAP
jgi:predicted MPP superfamily phosphohydrolase